MTTLNKSQTSRLLGYSVDARLLIINADDFGMCHAINEATLRTLKKRRGSVHELDGSLPDSLSLTDFRM